MWEAVSDRRLATVMHGYRPPEACSHIPTVFQRRPILVETLRPDEIRVLGSLIEKQIATPEYYPLTLNALMNACNQKSSREPVVSYDETTVMRALDGLREKKLIRMVSSVDSRVAKYRQVFTDSANLTQAELAILCVLMLRGPQTPGELRSRAERLCHFETLAEVEKALQRLIEREPEPLVQQLQRQAGTKESRFAHLLGGPVIEAEVTSPVKSIAADARIDPERLSRLEAEVESLRETLKGFQAEFASFKKQFE
jgi:uncharacterized protein YceH (UPF0502 family)